MQRSIVAVLAVMMSAIFVDAATTNRISRFGVTFEFSESVEFGTFANGDSWVVGPVTITNMTPPWDGVMNGWEVNPTYGGNQGFFAGEAGNAYGYTAELRPELPFTVNNAASVVKTIGTGVILPAIKTAVVLTVLTSVPPDGGSTVFRPPYIGTNKPLYSIYSLQSNLLPSFPSVSPKQTLATTKTNFSRSLMMDHHAWDARRFRPADVLENYSPENQPMLFDAMFSLMLDDPYSTKLPALVAFTQYCLDRAYIVSLGYRQPGTGHNPGHRILAAFGAVMLDITEIKDYLAAADGFHEDEFLQRSPVTGRVLWGQTASTEGQYWGWITSMTGSRSHHDPYGYIDGGNGAFGGGEYQIITSQSLKGSALAARLMPELQACFPTNRWANLNEYAERWVNVGGWLSPDPAAPYDGVPGNYGITFGPDGMGGFIPGRGRFIEHHGKNRDSGQYRSLFVAAMWNAYVGGGSPRPASPVNLRKQ